MKHLSLILAEAAQGAPNISVPWLLVLIVAGLYCIKHLNAKASHLAIGVAIGVVGAGGLIGTLVWSGLGAGAGLTH